MDVLWLIGNPAGCYRVPDQRLIVNAAGELLDGASVYQQQISSAEEWAALAAAANACVR